MSSEREVWEVWQGRTCVCSRTMRLTEAQARNKVENERRFGWHMEAVPVGYCRHCKLTAALRHGELCEWCGSNDTNRVAVEAGQTRGDRT